MKNYQDLLEHILINGEQQSNRTGIDAISLPGAMMQFDLQKGFPAVTTKKLAFNQVKGELIGFLRGYTSAADFRALGCTVWDQNSNENKAWLANPHRKGEDDLGRVYGAQWRGWRGADGTIIDQVQQAIDTIKNDPGSRRIIISAWKPDEFDQMALPPCHVLSQFLVNPKKREISMCMYQRSADMFLGVPFNIASYALLLSIVAHLTGYKPRFFTHFLADAHIYVNHLAQVETQISREPMRLPQLGLGGFDSLEELEPDMIQLCSYEHHPALAGAMAV